MMAVRLTSSASKLAFIFFFSFSLFVLYGQSHFYRDPGSVFYDPNRAYEQQYSALRLRQVEKFRSHITVHGSDTRTREPAQRIPPEICATITTSIRPDLDRQYVENTILSMLDGITSQERALLHLNLLFTDLDPTGHPSWSQPWLHNMLDKIWTHDDEDAEMRSWLEDASFTYVKTKAMMDYTLALQKCLDHTDAKYIAVIEGDTLFTAGWVAPTLQALRSADAFMQQRATSRWGTPSQPARDWSDMRLFNQERSTGWASQKVGHNNELPIILAIDLVLGCIILLLRRRTIATHTTSHFPDRPTLAVLLLLIVPVSVITFFQAGKASLLPPRPGLAVENFGCCSQALVFNRRHVPGLIEYLRDFAVKEANGTSGHVNYDMRTKDFAHEQGLGRLALYPMQVQHVGVKSALGTEQAEAQSVWSMAFEYQREEDVRERHDRAMDELFDTAWRID